MLALEQNTITFLSLRDIRYSMTGRAGMSQGFRKHIVIGPQFECGRLAATDGRLAVWLMREGWRSPDCTPVIACPFIATMMLCSLVSLFYVWGKCHLDAWRSSLVCCVSVYWALYLTCLLINAIRSTYPKFVSSEFPCDILLTLKSCFRMTTVFISYDWSNSKGTLVK